MPLEDERDFPELNKCPDCETFFADLTCPICGKICPEEMRAGNRKRVKVKKNPRHESHETGRVRFVPWYFTTWFIILMLFIQPLVGLILTWAGYWKKKWKILATVLLVLPYVLTILFGGVMGILATVLSNSPPPVDVDMPQAEYVALCQELPAETVYREANARLGEHVKLTMKVEGIWEDALDYGSKYPLFFECSVEADGKTWVFLVHDYRQGDAVNLAVGDEITVWGQIGGNESITNSTVGTLSKPCINALYIEVQN